MPNFKLSRKAKADLESIAEYTEQQWGRKQRNEYILRFDKCFRLLAETPGLGQRCDAIKPGYHQHRLGSHVLFYRMSAEGAVEIVRILHKSMLPNFAFRTN